MKKIRLTKSIVEEILFTTRCYSSWEVSEITFTPIIYKLKYQGGDAIYQKRVAVHIGCCVTYIPFRGKAPLHKNFTLKEFMDNFYMERDNNRLYIRYYKK